MTFGTGPGCTPGPISFSFLLLGKDSCQGDSGGPLVTRQSVDSSWYQVGIVSYGNRLCGTNEQPTVFTKLSSFLPWIESHLEE